MISTGVYRVVKHYSFCLREIQVEFMEKIEWFTWCFFPWSVSPQPHGTIEISWMQSPSVDHAFYEIPNHRTIAVKID